MEAIKIAANTVLATTLINNNEWVSVKANVKEDFKKLHDLDVRELNGIAIMTDTDNSKQKAVAYYQNIAAYIHHEACSWCVSYAL